MNKEKKYTFSKLLPDEVEYIKQNSATMPIKEISEYLGVSCPSVLYHIKKNNLPKYVRPKRTPEEIREYQRQYYAEYGHKRNKVNKTGRTYTRFTQEEIDFIGKHAAFRTDTDLANYFGCSPRSIAYQIKKNGFQSFTAMKHNRTF